MAKSLRCNDVIPGCTYVVRGVTEEEVMRQAAEHAHRTQHTADHAGNYRDGSRRDS